MRTGEQKLIQNFGRKPEGNKPQWRPKQSINNIQQNIKKYLKNPVIRLSVDVTFCGHPMIIKCVAGELRRKSQATSID